MLDTHIIAAKYFRRNGTLMELRVLRYFLAVAREGSVTGAANILHVTQPTLSRQLMDLEDELGHKLFVRGSHSVSLTEEGALLKKRAEEILDMVERTQSEFSAPTGDEVCGDVYIGGGETYGMKQIAAIVRELRKIHPCIRYHLYSGNADDVTEKLDKGLLDFGLLIQPADLSRYDGIDLSDKDRWGVLMRKDSPLAAKRAVQRKDLLSLPLIVSRQIARRISAKGGLAEWLGPDLERFNIVATYNLIYNAGVMVDEGVGYAIGLDRLADTGPDSSLCFRPLMPKLESGLSVIWKKERLFSKSAKIFLEKMRECFPSHD